MPINKITIPISNSSNFPLSDSCLRENKNKNPAIAPNTTDPRIPMIGSIMTDERVIMLGSRFQSAKVIAELVRITAAISSAARTNMSEDVTGPLQLHSHTTSAVAAGAVALATAPKRIAVGSGSGTANSITLDNNASRIVEQYKLAWTSYALVVDPTDGHLYLHYNFSPTRGINVGNIRSLIMEDVTTFKFKGAGRTIRFKICKEEQISADINENVTACKEKAVF